MAEAYDGVCNDISRSNKIIMMRTLTHLRDFMTEETLKFLPGNLRSANFIILRQNKETEQKIGRVTTKTFNTVLQVFDKDGTWVGEITHPDYIPDGKS